MSNEYQNAKRSIIIRDDQWPFNTYNKSFQDQYHKEWEMFSCQFKRKFSSIWYVYTHFVTFFNIKHAHKRWTSFLLQNAYFPQVNYYWITISLLFFAVYVLYIITLSVSINCHKSDAHTFYVTSSPKLNIISWRWFEGILLIIDFMYTSSYTRFHLRWVSSLYDIILCILISHISIVLINIFCVYI